MSYNTEKNIPFMELVGIVSFGPMNCGTKNAPGVYTKLSKYLEWIAENIED